MKWSFVFLMVVLLQGCADIPLNNGNIQSVNEEEDIKPTEPPLTKAQSRARKLREEFAVKLRDGFLDEGEDVYVYVEGRTGTCIRFKYVLLGEVWKHHFLKSPLVDRIYERGFREIKFTDSDDFTSGVTLSH